MEDNLGNIFAEQMCLNKLQTVAPSIEVANISAKNSYHGWNTTGVRAYMQRYDWRKIHSLHKLWQNRAEGLSCLTRTVHGGKYNTVLKSWDIPFRVYMKTHIPSVFTSWVKMFKDTSDFTFPFCNTHTHTKIEMQKGFCSQLNLR